MLCGPDLETVLAGMMAFQNHDLINTRFVRTLELTPGKVLEIFT